MKSEGSWNPEAAGENRILYPARSPTFLQEFCEMTAEHERTMIDEAVRTCTRCPLAATRISAVPGEGPVPARILFIGEAPGRNEDREGRPFVGRAGSILDGLLAGIGVSRDEVFITNIVKCRPPGNRDPKPEEIEACRPYLERQIALIRPEVIVPLGRFAMRWVLESHGVTPGPISAMHGTVVRIQWTGGERTVVPVYHPAATIYRPALRETLAADFATIRAVIGDRSPPGGETK